MRLPYLKGGPQFIRSLNWRLVISLLRRNGKMSRTDLVHAVGVKPSTITSIIQELIKEGLVVEVGVGPSTTVGRRPILLSLNHNYGQTLGAYVQSRCVVTGYLTLDGRLSKTSEAKYRPGSSPKTVLTALKKAASCLPAPSRLLGVGISVAGFVQSANNGVIYSPSMDWHEVDLSALFRQTFDAPVYLANDVNALAVGERWYGAGRHFQNFICVSVGEGIGAGIYLDSSLYEGANGGAGEVGHTCVQLYGPQCRCGEYGCLETLSSDSFLAREAKRHDLPADPEDLIERALAGDTTARDIFKQMGTHLGVGIKNLVNLFNPEAIIVGGDRINALGLFGEAMEEMLLKHSFSRISEHLKILPAKLGKAGWVIGAGTLPLRARFSPSVLTRTSLTNVYNEDRMRY